MKTISLQGKDYATVKDRLKQFREDCPNGLIETSPTIQADGQIMFKARVLKDKSKPESSEATGHSLGKDQGQKAFEKLETIAVGRALALLGYAQDGEIASGEEMEEFHAYQDELRKKRLAELEATLNKAKTMAALKKAWASIPSEFRTDLEAIKDSLKKKYESS